jgi:carbamate kinase
VKERDDHMNKKKVVVALGHKALGTTLPEQKTATKKAAKAIADLVEAGADVVISHSNAPQVGMIHTAMNEFGKGHPNYTVAPMYVCSAMSQGYIGYDIQNAVRCELIGRGIYKPVCTVLTQVSVDPYDDAFHNPTKVIGRCLTKEEAEQEEKKGNYVVEDKEGFRRIVAAPSPHQIIELDAIKTLLDAGQIVVACGGGGIPVLEQGIELHGASAVIEKDLTSGLLADLLQADQLLILTSVEKVSLNYQSDSEEFLGKITVAEAKKYMEDGQFEPSTMLPKIEAAVNFVVKGSGRTAVITSIPKAKEGFLEKAGTIIV